MRLLLKHGSQWGLAFAAIWGALYASGTLEKVIPEWVDSTTQISSGLGDAGCAEGECLMMLYSTSLPVEPDVWALVWLLVATSAVASLMYVIWRRVRA